ncbi:unnamed protein product [Lymnaea stagnalis]|uniref:Ig-like domain-containing protein n=1 Tax=Lymnaea stagnalis TaxID=6523 RepID=A0AAV2HM14_LYMST
MTNAAFLCVSLFLMTILMSSTPAFILERTPQKISFGQELSLECSSKGGGQDLTSVTWIRITRKLGRSWSKVAELRNFDSCVSFDQTASGDDVSATGHLGNADNTYLKLSWKSANLNILGKYRCELVGHTRDGEISVVTTPSISLTGDVPDDFCPTHEFGRPGGDISAKLSFLSSKVEELSNLVRAIYERETSLIQNADSIQAGLSHDGQSKVTASQDGQSKVTPSQDGQSKVTPSQDGKSKDTLSQDGKSKDTLSQDGKSKDTLSQDGKSKDTLSQDGHFEVTLSRRDELANFSFENLKWAIKEAVQHFADESSQMAESVTIKTSDIIVTPGPRLDLSVPWPGGSYALLAPETGCPDNTSDVFWRESFSRHHVESDTGPPVLLGASHVAKPLYETRDSNRFVFFRLCLARARIMDGEVWPKGGYCISRVGSLCPDGGFSSGYIQLDDENNQTERTHSELEAGVEFLDGVTRLHFCCRQDEDHSTPIFLPTQYPFYLYRYGGECQRVADMKVTQETLIFDTEDEANADSYENSFHPDGQLNDVNIYLCYYEKDNK